MFEKLTIYLDMGGKKIKNKFSYFEKNNKQTLSIDDIDFIHTIFSGFTKKIAINPYFNNVDTNNNYKEIYEVCKKLNDFSLENNSFINKDRLLIDPLYLLFLKDLKVKVVCLDIYGNRSNHDYFVNKLGDFNNLLKSIDLLNSSHIHVNLNYYLNKQNIKDLKNINYKFKDQDVSINYLQNKPTGLGFKNISLRLTKTDLNSLKDNEKFNLGFTEEDLYQYFLSHDFKFFIDDVNPIFYIDKEFNVYTSLLIFNKYNCLGNLKRNSTLEIVNNYLTRNTKLFNIISKYSFKEMVKTVGNIKGNWIFTEDDYKLYILNLMLIKEYQ